VVGRHTAGVALRSDGVQGSAVRARGKGANKQTNSRRKTFIYTMYKGDHLVKARSSGDGARDLGDVLGGKEDKRVFVLTSVGPGTSSWRRASSWRRSERTGRGVTGLRGCDGIRGIGGGLVRSLGERTGRRQGMSGMTWFAH
jgi:hypothetical protein